MKKITCVILFFIILAFVSGCSEGINVDGQKQIDFSFKQKGSNENWEVIDEISGTYYNVEQLISSTHRIEINPKLAINHKQISVSIKVGNEWLTRHKNDEKFKANLTKDGVYIVEQGLFIRLDDNERFWDERLTLVIEYGGKTEEIKLNGSEK